VRYCPHGMEPPPPEEEEGATNEAVA
jgi:hypothetical protein